MPNPFNMAKTAAEFIVPLGAGAVVSNAIKASTPENARLIQKISISIGGFVISSMVAEAAVKYTTGKIDKAAATFAATRDGIVIVVPTEDEKS